MRLANDVRELPVGTKVVAGAFAVSGVAHLIHPEVFEPLMPDFVPGHRTMIYASGAVELACLAGLVTRRSWAPMATTATLAAIWAGNWTMAFRWQRSSRRTPVQKAMGWARVPLQLPLMYWAWNSPIRDSETSGIPRTLEG